MLPVTGKVVGNERRNREHVLGEGGDRGDRLVGFLEQHGIVGRRQQFVEVGGGCIERFAGRKADAGQKIAAPLGRGGAAPDELRPRGEASGQQLLQGGV